MGSSLVDKQLRRIEELAEEKLKEIELLNYDKYRPVFDIAVAFFKKRSASVLLYGGTAINDLLPDKYKFYESTTLPDIDIFVPETKMESIAQALVNEYRRRGFSMPAYRPALHDNTLKVFAEGVQVADISGIPLAAFRKLKQGSMKSSFGFPIVNIHFLRLSLHAMLSQPFDAHRWKKVYQRVVNFYRSYPPPKCDPATVAEVSSAAPPDDAIIHDRIAAHVKQTGLVLFGFDALRLFFPKQFRQTGRASNSQPMFNILSDDDPLHAATSIVKVLRDDPNFSDPGALTISRTFASDNFVPDHCHIYHNKRLVAAIFRAEVCVNYTEHNGYRIASLQTMIRMYLSLLLSTYDHNKAQYPACIANGLSWLHIQLVKSPSRKKLLQSFLLECYGPKTGIFTMRRKALQRDENKQ